MKLYNGGIEDLRVYKSIKKESKPDDRLVSYLTEQHHKLCEEEITDDQFRDNVKLILR